MIKLQSKNKYLAYFAPVIMIIIGIFLYSVILPARYNKVISLMDWLFSGTDNIIATLRSADIVLGQFYRILFTKILVWVWTIGFLFSLFWCGYTVQNSKEKSGNLLIGEDGKKAMLVRIVNQAEKYYRLNKSNDDSKLIYKKAVILESRFLACGEFGYGSYDITELENHICNKLVELEKLLSDENYDYAEVNDKYIGIHNLLEEREAMLKHY